MKEHLKKDYNLKYRMKRQVINFKVGDKAIVSWEKSTLFNKEVIVTRKGFGTLLWVKANDKEVVIRSSQLKETT